jgi:hypothetical protein
MDPSSGCHSRLASLLGNDIEPIEVWRRTEEHRVYWRPERVKVVLLAESHVYTTAEELTRTLTLPSSAPRDIPRGFVRLVYCLGYGENGLLSQPISKNPGTPQFWKIFFSCVNAIGPNSSFSAILASTFVERRIANKISLLKQLREQGVWLVDTSLAALYGLPGPEGRKKPSSSILRVCLQASWDLHVRGVVENAAPSHIVCVGRGVAKALRSRLGSIKAKIAEVPQPNAHLTKEEHHQSFQTYFDVVRQANSHGGVEQCAPADGPRDTRHNEA